MSDLRGYCYSCCRSFSTSSDDRDRDEPRCPLCDSDFVEVGEASEGSSFPAPEPAAPPSVALRVTNLEDSNLVRDLGSSVLPLLRATMSTVFIREVGNAENTLERLARQFGGSPTARSSAASQALVESLPRRVVGEANENVPKNAETCVVCHEDYVGGDRLVELPCGHVFHERCILRWLGEHDTCPVCRRVLGEDQADQGGRSDLVPNLS